ncbi:hypothetical protein F2Q69_00009765 [Brassica cretica]|uniref:Uncharacterized protein n=1 Tax=Brassica cretica TaxID=69181 RepID=A0A8S9PBN4_BRACR|nr:hypothetical protein F2Q69_00009765 [Brassica cretica]
MVPTCKKSWRQSRASPEVGVTEDVVEQAKGVPSTLAVSSSGLARGLSRISTTIRPDVTATVLNGVMEDLRPPAVWSLTKTDG